MADSRLRRFLHRAAAWYAGQPQQPQPERQTYVRVLHSKELNPRAIEAANPPNLNYTHKANEPSPDQRDLEQVETYHDVVWRCIQTKAEDAAGGAVLRLYNGTVRDPGDEITDHALLELLDKPAPDIGGKEFLQSLYADIDATGDTFWYLYGNGRPPVGLSRFRPCEITVLPDPTGKRNIGGYYWNTHDGSGLLGVQGKGERGIPWEKMLHMKQRNPRTSLRGLGALHRLRMRIEIDRVMQEWNWNRYSTGIPTEYLIFFRGQLGEDERREAEQRLRAKFGGPGGDPFMLLEGDGEGNALWDVKQFPRPSEDELAFLDSEQRLVYAIGRAFNVPPNKLMDYEQSTRIANADAMERTYWEDSIMALHSIFLDAMNSRYLPAWFPGEKLHLAYDYSNVRALQQSAVELATVDTNYVREGILTRNEVRIARGYDPLPIPEMDEPLVNGRKLGSNPDPFAGLLGMGMGGGEGPGKRPPSEDDQEQDDETTPPGDDDEDLEEERARRLWMAALAKLRERKKQDDSSPLLLTEPLLDLEEEAETFARLVRAKLRIMVARAGQQHLDLSGISASFNVDDPEVLRFMEDMLVELTEAVVTNTNEMVRARMAEAYAEQLGVTELRERLQSAFKERREDWQLDRIARTESHQATEGAGFQASRQSGVEFKRWLSSRDSRVRGLDPKDQADHQAMEELGPVPLDAPFVDQRSGAQLMFPGDRRGAVTGADTINCRCSWIADHSHLELSTRAGIAKAPTFDEVWRAKASRRDDMEIEIRRLIRKQILDMERRALRAFAEHVAGQQESAGSGTSP